MKLRPLITSGLAVVLAAALGVVLAAGVTAATPEPAQASTLGGKITRSEVLARAQNWVDRGIKYDMDGAYAGDAEGDHSYRRDCSGMVSMAWHLNTSYSTGTFGSAPIDHLSGPNALKPGDAMLKTGHMEMFSHWKNPSDHTKGAYVYSFNSTGETVRNPYEDSNHGNLGFNSWSDVNNYTSFFAYKNIIDDVPQGTANVYGILADGRISYSAIDAATGNRKYTALSTTEIGFTPKAMATLNFNTLVVASTGGDLYRVDIVSNKDTVTFSKTKFADSGWAYDHLAYDGYGHLFGISGANKTLRRIFITEDTHYFRVDTSAVVGDGFNLNTLTTTGSNWILGTADDGRLLSYKISGGDDPWTGYLLKGDGWGGVTHLLSPGGGAYYAKYATGALYHYTDGSAYDGKGGDIAYHLDDPVDTSGWTQVLLSAQPRTVTR